MGPPWGMARVLGGVRFLFLDDGGGGRTGLLGRRGCLGLGRWNAWRAEGGGGLCVWFCVDRMLLWERENDAMLSRGRMKVYVVCSRGFSRPILRCDHQVAL